MHFAARRGLDLTVIERLTRLAPVLFELGARPHPPRDLYRAYLDQSHIFIGIYWQKYGWVAPGETISGLEDEYQLSGNKPKLIYIKAPAPEREPRLKVLLEQLKSQNTRERSASRTEINKRFSFPFACVAFAIIGVPLGVTAHRRETSIGFAMGLIVATTYFLFVIIGDTLRGNPHAHPELLVWFPNVLFIVLGVFLFRRLARQ